MIPDHIKEQMRAGEGLHTEFKRDATDLAAIAKAVCGFLNSKGGSVFCGLDDSGRIVGLPAVEGLAREVHDYLLKVITPPPLLSVNADDEAGKHILTVEVPEGKDRPYVCGGSVFVRRGPAAVAADSQTLRDIVQLKAVAPERWERRPSMAMDEEDLDREELARTVAEAQESGRFTLETPNDPSAVLRSLGMYLAQGFTQGADVLFARNPAQRHPQTRVRLTRFGAGKVGDTYLDDRQLQGPLVKVFEQLFETVSGHVATEARFEPGRARRNDRPAYPIDAIREGLINALAHRDYAGFSGGVSVGIHEDRIEIWNSGRLPEGIKPGDLRRNHPSLPTNPDIAQVFYVRGLMERIGRGTQKIVQACKDRGLRPPQWKDEPSGVTLTLFGPFRPRGADVELNSRQQALVAGTATGERLRLAEYRERFAPDVTERQARRDLQALEQQGVLRREGEGRGTSYVRLNRT